MSLHVYTDLVQGSDEWLDARCGMLTASTIGQLVTAKTLKVAANADTRAITALLVSERITGRVEDSYVSADMLRGTECEPYAIAAYEEHTGARVDSCGLIVRTLDDGTRVGYSPDGLVGDEGLIEIKTRIPKIHVQTVVAGGVPAANIAQIQAGLWITGRAWCDYVSFSGGMHLWTMRVYPDPAWAEALAEAVRVFEDAAAQMTDTYTRAVVGLPMTERVEIPEVVV